MRVRIPAASGAAILGLALGLASAASAARVTFEVEAVVRGIYDASDASIPVWEDTLADFSSLGIVMGAPVRGTVSYDDAAAYSLGAYDGSSIEITFEVGAWSVSEPAGEGLAYGYTWTEGDEYVQFSRVLDPGPLAGTMTDASLLLFGPSLEDWVDGSLPSSAPPLDSLHPFDLAAFQDQDILTMASAFGFGIRRCLNEFPCQTVSVVGEITRLETVPEPALPALAAAAVLALTVARRR